MKLIWVKKCENVYKFIFKVDRHDNQTNASATDYNFNFLFYLLKDFMPLNSL